MDHDELRKQIMSIQQNSSLSDADKARMRQDLLCGKWAKQQGNEESNHADQVLSSNQELTESDTLFNDTLCCTMCMELCNRPVTASCQHNFCLGCFTKWINQNKKTCPTCRHPIAPKFAANPRINTALAYAIRTAKHGIGVTSKRNIMTLDNQNRPDEAYTTDRAVRSGRANAASGRIMVNVPSDFFGPITSEYDPRGTGVLVGEFWRDRLDCRQWGVHFPHVAGIAGQGHIGAQSVVLSGGYIDDRDEGDWFLYTGSGGRDLSGNKRVNNMQSFDQKFEKSNRALLVSCEKGLPIRVVRSHKEKRSVYAPTEEQPVRYDGVYRIHRAYRVLGAQGYLVCRFLFHRCDNAAAPWSTSEHGDGCWDGTIPELAQLEIDKAIGKIYKMADNPWWDYDLSTKLWGWSRAPPVSQKLNISSSIKRKRVSSHERALNEFKCQLCNKILDNPVSTPCGHHFCKPCIDKKFMSVGEYEARSKSSIRTLRTIKATKPCPTCKVDIAEFLSSAQINRGMMEVIEKLKASVGTSITPECKDSATCPESGYEAQSADLKKNSTGDKQCNNLEASPILKQDEEADAKSSKYCTSSELSKLSKQYPQFDNSLLCALLEDQYGDVEEVIAYLKILAQQGVEATTKT